MHPIAAAADENLAVHFTYVHRRLEGMRVREDLGVLLADSGLPCDTFNAACRARLAADTAAARIREAIGWFVEGGRPFSWWVGPGDEPGDLGVLLDAEGLAAAESELAMQADLATARLEVPAPAGFTVQRVRTPAELERFAAITAANWTPPDPHVHTFYERAAGVLLESGSPLRFYLGYLDGEPVAASEMTLGGGVVGLYNISTASAFRGRGFGSEMTAAPLREARDEGIGTAILQAAPAGVSIYRRIGFATFGEITEYKPALAPADEAAA